ncbi:MAG: type II toxin-antitoxin system VapC family toxin [Eggerthellaceae bacterium]|jgi:predicted nucleic acid-binding protein|nr:type II toxin-antitoxin system VapC family toxin [Eggerthellaceae bacterium]MDR2716236.1 type II toxin-antitoxin system VapC family toxin [Coriobacteriaceae bacterium]
MTPKPLVVDTNIISETLKEKPHDGVMAWLLQNQENLYLTSVTIGELFIGAYRLPIGKRRESLLSAIGRISSAYENRIYAYDGAAARVYARMQDETRRSGRLLTVEDGMIAATCASSQAVLATRNVKDFSHLGIPLVNPFEEPTPDVVEIRL